MKDSLNKMMTDFDALTGHRWEQAIKSVQEQSFDLVLSDFYLDHSNGEAIFGALNQSASGLAAKMIFLTGAVLDEHFQEFLQQNNLTCLYKPFYAQELLDLIRDKLTVS